MRRALPLLPALCALAAGCGGSGADEGELRGAAAVAAPAVAVRAELSAALVARPWLTAASVRATLIDGGAAPTALAARRTLDTSAVELAERLGAAVGEERATLALLRRQDALWAQAGVGRALGDQPLRTAAESGLTRNRRALAALLATEGLEVRQLERELEPAYASLRAAVDAVATGRTTAPRRTATAAQRALRPGPDLARAAKRRRPQLRGSPVSPAAELATLAAVAFTDHAHAQYAADALAVGAGRGGPRAVAANRVLDDAADVTAQFVASVLGEDAGERWGALWRGQSAGLRAYAAAKGREDAPAAARALGRLGGLRTATVALLAEVDPDGTGTPLTAALRDHAEAMTATIRAQAIGSPKAAPRQLAAAAASRAVGRALADRFAARFPEKFPAS